MCFEVQFLLLVKIVVVKPDGPPKLCKTDEVGELCVASGTVGSAYFGLVGKTNHTFKVGVVSIHNFTMMGSSALGQTSVTLNNSQTLIHDQQLAMF